MEFFDKITETASKTYKYTTEKTSKLAKEVKLKTLINQDKEKISEIYEEIGKNVYQSHISKNDKEILEIENEEGDEIKENTHRNEHIKNDSDSEEEG